MKKAKKKINTAILIIGNEILSGRTQDLNVSFISNWLNINCGISVSEVRIIPDVQKKIISNVIKDLDIKAKIFNNVYDDKIESNIIVCRAFKKLDHLIQVSREIVKKPHKLIVLKGKNAQEELNKAFKNQKYPYRMIKSMTNQESKIIIIEFN